MSTILPGYFCPSAFFQCIISDAIAVSFAASLSVIKLDATIVLVHFFDLSCGSRVIQVVLDSNRGEDHVPMGTARFTFPPGMTKTVSSLCP